MSPGGSQEEDAWALVWLATGERGPQTKRETPRPCISALGGGGRGGWGENGFLDGNREASTRAGFQEKMMHTLAWPAMGKDSLESL